VADHDHAFAELKRGYPRRAVTMRESDIKRPWHLDFCRAAARLPRRSRTKAGRQAATSMTARRRAPALQAENQGLLVSSDAQAPLPAGFSAKVEFQVRSGARQSSGSLTSVAFVVSSLLPNPRTDAAFFPRPPRRRRHNPRADAGPTFVIKLGGGCVVKKLLNSKEIP